MRKPFCSLAASPDPETEPEPEHHVCDHEDKCCELTCQSILESHTGLNPAHAMHADELGTTWLCTTVCHGYGGSGMPPTGPWVHLEESTFCRELLVDWLGSSYHAWLSHWC